MPARGHELPVALAHRPVIVMAPPEQFVRRRGVGVGQRCGEALSMQRRNRPAVMNGRGSDMGKFEHRRHHVDHVHRLAPQFPPVGEARRPVDDPRRGDASFVNPCLVAAEGGIRAGGPTRPEAEVGAGGPGQERWIVAFAADHHLCRRAVVAGEQDEGVVERPHRFQLAHDRTHRAIHHLHHRGVDRHLRGLELLLLGRERVPGQRSIRLTGAELRQRAGAGGIRRADVRLGGRRIARHQPLLADPQAPCPPHRVPSSCVAGAIFGDEILRCVERKVRGREGDVLKERAAGMTRRVVPEARDRVLPDGRRHVEIRFGFERLAIDPNARGIEVVVLGATLHPGPLERSGEALPSRVAGDVPLPGVIADVAGRCEQFRQEPRPRGPHQCGAAPVLPVAVGQRVTTDRLGVVAGEQRASRWPAACGVVALRVAEPAGREPVEMRRVDFAPVASEIGEAEVIGQNHDDVRGATRRLVGRTVAQRQGDRDDDGHDPQQTAHGSAPVERDGRQLCADGGKTGRTPRLPM